MFVRSSLLDKFEVVEDWQELSEQVWSHEVTFPEVEEIDILVEVDPASQFVDGVAQLIRVAVELLFGF